MNQKTRAVDSESAELDISRKSPRRAWFCLALAVMAGGVTAQAGTVRAHARPIAVSGSEQNPYTYIYGLIAHGNLIRDDKGRLATNVTFQPRYASEIFNENVLFCGDRASSFDNIETPVVVTYKRVPHQMVRGVPCFDLVSVDRVDSNQMGPEARR